MNAGRKCKYSFFWIWCLHLLLNCFLENCFRNYTFSKICAAVLSQTFNGILTAKNPFVLFYFLFLYFPCHIITLGRSISIFITLPYKMKTVNKFSKWIKMINSVKENDLTDCNSLFLNLSLQFFKLIHRNHLLGPLYMAISNQWHPKPIPFNAK